MKYKGWFIIWLIALPVWGIPGDIDQDGDVDFDDFFILGDNFGKKGPPEYVRITVYDTITVEFVNPPNDVSSTTQPDYFIKGLSFIRLRWTSSSIVMDAYSREPIDRDDRPVVPLNYGSIPIAASMLIRYASLSVEEDLRLAAPDTLELWREVFLLDRRHFDPEKKLDLLRFPEIANTSGDMIFDLVLRTPLQGDFVARVITPVRFSEVGKMWLN